MNYITSPDVQAQVAEYFGEAPANPKACALTTDPEHCDDVPRRPTTATPRALLLDDAHQELPRRQRRRVHRSPGLGEGLERHQGLTHRQALTRTTGQHRWRPRRRSQPAGGGQAPPVPRPPPAAAAGLVPRRAAGCGWCSSTSARWRCCSSRRCTDRRVHQRGRPVHPHARQLPRHRRSDGPYPTVTSAPSASPWRSRVDRPRCSPCRSRSSWPRSPRRGCAALLARRPPAAAVGELPGEGVLLAGDPRPGERRAEARPSGFSPGFGHDRARDPARLPVAAVHDPADLRRPRAPARLAARRVGRPRRQGVPHRSGRWCCRCSCRRSSPDRSSRSRSRSATTSPCRSSAARPR